MDWAEEEVKLRCRLKMPWPVWGGALKKILLDRLALHQMKMAGPCIPPSHFIQSLMWAGLEALTLSEEIPEGADS